MDLIIQSREGWNEKFKISFTHLATRRRQGNGKKFNRVSITENPFLTMDDEPSRKNDGMSMENRLVQKDKYSSLEDMAMQETVFATADDLDVYKDTLIL